MSDIIVTNHLSVVLVTPASDAGRVWIAENVDPDAQWFGRSLVVEPRYLADILEGMSSDGLEVA